MITQGAAPMGLESLLEDLSRPTAYAHPTGAIEVIQTHASAVFLAGAYAYKLKKPVNFGFLDYSTPQKREHFAKEELRLNRRFARAVYISVEPVVRTAHGAVIGPRQGEVVDHVVKMHRLPEDRTFMSLLNQGVLTPEIVERCAFRLARAYSRHVPGERLPQKLGSFEVVKQNIDENIDQLAAFAGRSFGLSQFAVLREATLSELDRLRPLIEARQDRAIPTEIHGDLRLEHVYFLDDRPPPDDLEIIDCIEFNERFRFGDPVQDVAFLAMDLETEQRRDLARLFSSAYFRAARDWDGHLILPFFVAYRALVRAKVESFKLDEAEISLEDKANAVARVGRYVSLGVMALRRSMLRAVNHRDIVGSSQ